MFDGVLNASLNAAVSNPIKEVAVKTILGKGNYHSVKYCMNQNKDITIFFGPPFRNYF